MELQVSSPKDGGLSPSDCVSDPEEKEISDDDDDRNHKHRRRETGSQSLERDSVEQVLERPYRKQNKAFENGRSHRENNSHSSDIWNNSSMYPLEKRCTGLPTFPQVPNRVNQSLTSDLGPGRGRGRESISWNQHDPRFNSIDIASQMVPQGSFTPSLFAGRGLLNVSNSQNASWSAFGLIPAAPNRGVDTLHSLGLQGTFRPSIRPSLNLSIPRCRDFEERGFCLRGDMCPMEHGVNRIVVEDVQSLSQFNLPGSLPSAPLLGTTAPSSTMVNSKSLHSKSSRPGMENDGVCVNGVFTGSADFYDPDQPLWTNDCPETATGLLGLNSSKLDETESLLDADLSGRHHGRLFGGVDNERLVRSTAAAVGSQSTSSSLRGRITKSKPKMKGKIDSTKSSFAYIENEADKDKPSSNLEEAAKRIISEDIGSQATDSSRKMQGDTRRNMRKPSEKALRTLFVSGIPHKDNKREALFSHFQKFGDVVDIYIPLNGERAFVQFSNREEAEAALMAPDAVMGNRFIKLWWANRDSVPDPGFSGDNASGTPRGVAAPQSVAHGGKDGLQSAASKTCGPNFAVAAVLASDHPKPVINNVPQAPPPLQKKLENLELLKEELRKKQELLDQKRNDFRRQLDKIEKQATGFKCELSSEQAAKRHKSGTVYDVAKAAIPGSADSGTVMASPLAEVMAENKSVENVVHQISKPNAIATLQEPLSLKHSIRPLAPAGAPFFMNRFKLDNRPTAFKIIPPLPIGLSNVAVLKEHFSAYGELSAVELEDLESCDSVESTTCSADISFTTRRSAEMAFANGKCWQGHDLQFTWLACSNFSRDNGVRGNPSSSTEVPSDPAGEAAPIDSHKVAAPANGESEILDRKESGGECLEQDEDLPSSSSAISPEKQSVKGDVCLGG